VTASKPVLTRAIERRDWSLAAICLLLGVADAASRLPPDALESLLELLDGLPDDRRDR
jgi:hypothetical protein